MDRKLLRAMNLPCVLNDGRENSGSRDTRLLEDLHIATSEPRRSVPFTGGMVSAASSLLVRQNLEQLTNSDPVIRHHPRRDATKKASYNLSEKWSSFKPILDYSSESDSEETSQPDNQGFRNETEQFQRSKRNEDHEEESQSDSDEYRDDDGRGKQKGGWRKKKADRRGVVKRRKTGRLARADLEVIKGTADGQPKNQAEQARRGRTSVRTSKAEKLAWYLLEMVDWEDAATFVHMAEELDVKFGELSAKDTLRREEWTGQNWHASADRARNLVNAKELKSCLRRALVPAQNRRKNA